MQKSYRLKSSRAFSYIYRRGKSVSSKCIVLIFAPTRYTKKFGISIGKKVGGSVVRNRYKRIIREIVTKKLENYTNGYNYIIVARTAIVEKNYHELEEEFNFLLEKLEKVVNK